MKDAPPLIGIVGATGAVGRATARWLRASGDASADVVRLRLRLGGRRIDALRAIADSDLCGVDRGNAHSDNDAGRNDAIEIHAVDVDAPDALSRFCDGCRIIVNCAGPAAAMQDRVAQAAFAAGAEYVDPGGDDDLHGRLTPLAAANPARTAILSAGLLPGLSGLLPRWLARQGFDRVRALTAYVRLRDRFTPAAAIDYLRSVGGAYGDSLAAWRGGVRVTRDVHPLLQVELPLMPGRVNAYPYLTREAERMARALALSDLRWYHVFDDDRIVTLVARLQAMAGTDGLAAAGAALTRAIDVELFGRAPSQVFVLRLEGDADGRPAERTAIFRSDDTYVVSGAVAGLAVEALLRTRVEPGLHFAADVLDPAWVVDRVRACRAVQGLDVVDGVVAAGMGEDEGVL